DAREALPRRDPPRRGPLRAGPRPPRVPVLARGRPRALPLAGRFPPPSKRSPAARRKRGARLARLDGPPSPGPRALAPAAGRARGGDGARGVRASAAPRRETMARPLSRGVRHRGRVRRRLRAHERAARVAPARLPLLAARAAAAFLEPALRDDRRRGPGTAGAAPRLAAGARARREPLRAGRPSRRTGVAAPAPPSPRRP